MHLQNIRWLNTLAVVAGLFLLAAPVWAQGGPPPVESQGKPIDPMQILGGPGSPYQTHSREQTHAICNDRWNECAAICDKKMTTGSQNACLKQCNRQQEKCLDTYP